MAISVLGILIIVVISLVAVVATGLGWLLKSNPNRIPCPGCGKMIMTPIARCPKCGRDMT
jgi:hypothetical protein